MRILSDSAEMSVFVTPLLCSSWLKSLTVALASSNPGYQHVQGEVSFSGGDELWFPLGEAIFIDYFIFQNVGFQQQIHRAENKGHVGSVAR